MLVFSRRFNNVYVYIYFRINYIYYDFMRCQMKNGHLRNEELMMGKEESLPVILGSDDNAYGMRERFTNNMESRASL